MNRTGFANNAQNHLVAAGDVDFSFRPDGNSGGFHCYLWREGYMLSDELTHETIKVLADAVARMPGMEMRTKIETEHMVEIHGKLWSVLNRIRDEIRRPK